MNKPLVLVVEDDEKIAQLERDYLESSRYETALVRDGLQVAEQKIHPHGHGWSLVNNVDQWSWN